MVPKITVVFVAFAMFNAISAQVIRNFGCGCGCGGVDVIPNQVFLNQPGLVAQPGLLAASGLIPGLASNLCSPAIVNGQYALPSSNTIIQDNTVANNLANTLQLLLVSNLLSSTLPNSPDLLAVPAVSPCPCPYAGGLSYIC